MSSIDINKLIYENITNKSKKPDDSISLNEAYFNSVVDQISKSEKLSVDDLKANLPEIFENKESMQILANKLTAVNIFIEGFNIVEENKSSILESSIIGAISSGISVKKYFMSGTKS